MTHVAAYNRKRDHHRPWDKRAKPLRLLDRVAAEPWALSFTSFIVTALLIREGGLIVL
jgi:hypothetical protein